MSELSGQPGRLVSDKILAEPFSATYPASAEPTESASAGAATQQQREAVAALIDHDNGEIFAWLKLARSARRIEPIPEQRPGSAHLSPSHIYALFALKDCPNDRLLGWLELARLFRNDPTAMAFERGPLIDSRLSNNLPSLLDQSDPLSFEKILWTDLTKNPSRPSLSPLNRLFATDDPSGHHPSRSVNSTRSNNAYNHYWCTVCEEPKSYKDSGNWKKHEKEHETIFICGLDDAAENSKASQNHASKSFTCKRRDIMVNHLYKSHGIVEAHHGRDLADRWRHTVKKQAWSCGFCISTFLTFQDRLKHVDIEHFRKHQSIHEWDLNKVILGLLQQPRMETAWKTRTALLPPWVDPENLAWDKATAKDLRVTLEIGPTDDHHANTLADAAYSASNRNDGSWPLIGTTHVNRNSDTTAQASFFSSLDQFQATPALTSDSGLHHCLNSAITGSTAHHISGDPSFAGAPTSAFPLGHTVEPWMPASDTEGRVDRNELIFNPSQNWTSVSGPGTFLNGYEQSESYGG